MRQLKSRLSSPLWIALLTLILLSGLLLAGCSGTESNSAVTTVGSTVFMPTEPDATTTVTPMLETDISTEPAVKETDAPITTAADTSAVNTTAIETITATETTAATTEGSELWAPETGIFNEGNVNYEKVVVTEIVATFPDELVGKPVSVGDTGVTALFTADFTDGDVTVGGKAAPRSTDAVKVVDGKLYLPYDSSSETNLGGSWTTWAPVPGASVKSCKQVVLSTDWEIVSASEGAWMTAFWGCYVSNYGSKIPDGPGDGLWISFQKNASKLTVYHPDANTWPGGLVDVSLEEGVLNGRHNLSIVCTPNYTTYVYITPEDEDTACLVCTVTFEDGKMKIYNQANDMVSETECTTQALKGENFSLFVHGGGGAMVDEISVLACSEGETVEHVTVNATPTEGSSLGLDITDKSDLVSICYSIWFDAILGGGAEPVTEWNNITEILAGNQEWGGVNAFHYWAKPALGYYRSSDKTVIRTHMTQLYKAGVDFMIIDLTNATDGYIGSSNWTSYIEKPMNAICDTIMEMRAEGQGTPYVVFWVGDSEGPLYQALYDEYHAIEKWKDCFVYWNGKPFMLTTHKSVEEFPLQDLFTTRAMWGLNNNHSTNHWSFLNINNYGTVSNDADGNPEQISVAVASQETYMSEPTAHSRNHGIFWYVQWNYAFEVHPKVVTLTWWNEWTAQRLKIGEDKYGFTDNYNQNYSRDIEPMEGGHGDTYYQWLKQYIAHYKAGLPCPILVEDGWESRVDRYLAMAKG